MNLPRNRTEISTLQSNVEYLTNRMLNSERNAKLDNNPISYGNLTGAKGKSKSETGVFSKSLQKKNTQTKIHVINYTQLSG